MGKVVDKRVTSERPDADAASPKGEGAGTPVVAPVGKAVLRKAVLAAIGRDEVTRAADRYLKQFGVPEDFEFLTQMLDHRSEERVLAAIAAIDRLLARQRPARTITLGSKLRYLVETSYEAPIRDAAARLRAKL